MLQKLDSEVGDLPNDALIGSMSSPSQEGGAPLDANITILGSERQQKLLQRSFLNKFEQDYMNPIFGGPETVSHSRPLSRVVFLFSYRLWLFSSLTCLTTTLHYYL